MSSSNGGSTWTTHNTGAMVALNGISAIADNWTSTVPIAVIVVGDVPPGNSTPASYGTSDNGASWYEHTTGATADLLGVYIATTTVAYAWGKSATFRIGVGHANNLTIDTASLASVGVFGSASVTSVFFGCQGSQPESTPCNNMYAVGTGGLSAFSMDYGGSWAPYPTGPQIDFFHVDFVSATNAVLVGASGTIYTLGSSPPSPPPRCTYWLCLVRFLSLLPHQITCAQR